MRYRYLHHVQRTRFRDEIPVDFVSRRRRRRPVPTHPYLLCLHTGGGGAWQLSVRDRSYYFTCLMIQTFFLSRMVFFFAFSETFSSGAERVYAR